MVNSWERKTLTFISQTNNWNRDGQISSFLSFSIALLSGLTGAYMALELDFEDEVTARIKEATPAYLNDIIFNPAPVLELLSAHEQHTIFWSDIPPRHGLNNLFEAMSSAVIMPVNGGPANAVIILGWSEPQQFDASFKECLELIRERLKEIIWQSHLQEKYTLTTARYTTILDTLPEALVFISNEGQAGWVNASGARLLQLDKAGEHAPIVISGAMSRLIGSAANRETIQQEAMQLFTSLVTAANNMHWELENGARNVSCLPADGKGRLWIFR